MLWPGPLATLELTQGERECDSLLTLRTLSLGELEHSLRGFVAIVSFLPYIPDSCFKFSGECHCSSGERCSGWCHHH